MNAKFIIIGDPSLSRFTIENAFWTERSNAYLKKQIEIGFVHLTEEDVVRHPVVNQRLFSWLTNGGKYSEKSSYSIY